MSGKKPFFASHARSGAAVVSPVVHAVTVVVALFFVAVSVIRKDEVDFEAKPVSRLKMALKTLQVPVNVEKPPQAAQAAQTDRCHALQRTGR